MKQSFWQFKRHTTQQDLEVGLLLWAWAAISWSYQYNQTQVLPDFKAHTTHHWRAGLEWSGSCSIEYISPAHVRLWEMAFSALRFTSRKLTPTWQAFRKWKTGPSLDLSLITLSTLVLSKLKTAQEQKQMILWCSLIKSMITLQHLKTVFYI